MTRILFWLWLIGTALATAAVFWKVARVLWQEHQDAKALRRHEDLLQELKH